MHMLITKEVSQKDRIVIQIQGYDLWEIGHGISNKICASGMTITKP